MLFLIVFPHIPPRNNFDFPRFLFISDVAIECTMRRILFLPSRREVIIFHRPDDRREQLEESLREIASFKFEDAIYAKHFN